VRRFTGHDGGIWDFAVFSGEKRVIAVGEKSVSIWDMETGERLGGFEGPTKYVETVAVSPDGRYALTGEKAIRLWDLATGREIRTFMQSDDERVRAIAFLSGGGKAVSAGADSTVRLDGTVRLNRTIRLWKVPEGEEIGRISSPGPYYAIAVLPGGKRVLAAGKERILDEVDNDLELRELRDNGGVVMKMHGHEDSVTCLAVSRDGAFAVSGSVDGEILLWDLATGKMLRKIIAREFTPLATLPRVRSVAFSPDGKRLLSSTDGGKACLWDAGTGERLGRFQLPSRLGKTKGSVSVLTFLNDGEHVLTGGSWQDAKQRNHGELLLWRLPIVFPKTPSATNEAR